MNSDTKSVCNGAHRQHCNRHQWQDNEIADRISSADLVRFHFRSLLSIKSYFIAHFYESTCVFSTERRLNRHANGPLYAKRLLFNLFLVRIVLVESLNGIQRSTWCIIVNKAWATFWFAKILFLWWIISMHHPMWGDDSVRLLHNTRAL